VQTTGRHAGTRVCRIYEWRETRHSVARSFFFSLVFILSLYPARVTKSDFGGDVRTAGAGRVRSIRNTIGYKGDEETRGEDRYVSRRIFL